VSKTLKGQRTQSFYHLSFDKDELERLMKDIQQKFDKIKQECIELSNREHNTLT
jgi:hypothetical protein